MDPPLDERPWVIQTVAAVASAVIKANGLSLRWEVAGWDHVARLEAAGERALFCFWHNRLLYICYYLSRLPLTMLISQSKDGAYISAVARWYGIQAVRGSSTRGGARALAALVALLRRGERHVGITPDGPKGPLYQVQPGLVALAQKTGRPVLPVALSATRVHRFASWDRFLVPLPFARVRLVVGEPLRLDPERHRFEAERARVTAVLRRLTAEADRACGQPVDPELEAAP
ncbi:MAG: DUF374 domain-containing protein [Nitrospirae bacterium]|nr:MAG: DUF374 domain-containing protein [Nitrospirota bacterium]